MLELLRKLVLQWEEKQKWLQNDRKNWTNQPTLTHSCGVESGYDFCTRDLKKLIVQLEQQEKQKEVQE